MHSDFDEDYTYDNLNRLIDTNRDATDYQAWSLDALGNSNSVTTGVTTENRTHNSQNQLTQMGSNSLAFDANGNTTTDQHGRTLIYDGWNRLVEAKNGATSLIRYEYDGLKRRIEEADSHQYFSDQWQVLEKRDDSDNVVSQYVWSPVYVDAMILRDRNTSGDDSVLEERLYVLQDANFNVTAIVGSNESIVERYLYDPYGKRIVLDANFATDSDNTSDFDFQHGFQGGKHDPVLTSHVLFQRRITDVEQMRWLTEDPIGMKSGDGISLYQYVRGNPIKFLDPMGLRAAPAPVSPPPQLTQTQLNQMSNGTHRYPHNPWSPYNPPNQIPLLPPLPLPAPPPGYRWHEGPFLSSPGDPAPQPFLIKLAAVEMALAKAERELRTAVDTYLAANGGSKRPPTATGFGCPDPCEEAIQYALGYYRDVTKLLPPGLDLNAHHLNQRAAYEPIIPRDMGVVIGLRGNAFVDLTSPHSLFHQALELFWKQYRLGGELQGKKPTNADYGNAVTKALEAAGCAPQLAAAFSDYAKKARTAFGLQENDPVPNLPGQMNFRKP